MTPVQLHPQVCGLMVSFTQENRRKEHQTKSKKKLAEHCQKLEAGELQSSGMSSGESFPAADSATSWKRPETVGFCHCCLIKVVSHSHSIHHWEPSQKAPPSSGEDESLQTPCLDSKGESCTAQAPPPKNEASTHSSKRHPGLVPHPKLLNGAKSSRQVHLGSIPGDTTQLVLHCIHLINGPCRPPHALAGIWKQ